MFVARIVKAKALYLFPKNLCAGRAWNAGEILVSVNKQIFSRSQQKKDSKVSPFRIRPSGFGLQTDLRRLGKELICFCFLLFLQAPLSKNNRRIYQIDV